MVDGQQRSNENKEEKTKDTKGLEILGDVT